MILLILGLVFLLSTANMTYADTVILEEHFPSDPIERGWSYDGDAYIPFTWYPTAGNEGAMFTTLNHGPDLSRYTELISPSFSTLGATTGSVAFNYQKDNHNGTDCLFLLQYRLNGSGNWVDIWSSGYGNKPWPTEVNQSLPQGVLNKAAVELRWHSRLTGSFTFMTIDIIVDDVVLSIAEEPTPAPTNTPTSAPTSTPAPDCIHNGDVNQDGVITAADAQLAFLITLGQYAPTYDEECAADCNGDAVVTSADAQQIFQTGLGTADCVDPLNTPAPATNTPKPTNTPVPVTNTPSLPTNTPTNTPEPTDTPIPNETPTPTATSPSGFVFIPAGSYTSGSPPDEPCRNNYQTFEGQHTVTLTHPFYLMETEVTRQMWADLRVADNRLPADTSDTTVSPTMNHPANTVYFRRAVLYANLLSLKEGLTPCYYSNSTFTTPITDDNANYMYYNPNANGYHIPTDAEWEYACRAGTTGAFSFDEPNYGSSNCTDCTSETFSTMEDYAVFCANASGAAAVVGSKQPNPWELYDMHGNVREWVWDLGSDHPTGPVTDPLPVTMIPRTTSAVLSRGGSWFQEPKELRSAARAAISPQDYIGFRLARTIF